MSDCRDKKHRADIAIRISNANSGDDIAIILADIADSFGFLNWFMRDIPVGDHPPVASGLHISNVDPVVAAKLDNVFGNRDKGLVSTLKGLFSPSTWHIRDIDREASAKNEAVWNVLHDSSMDFGICFPVLDVAGGGRVICFTGTRDPLSDCETEQLDYIIIQIHGRISSIIRATGDNDLQLTALELECLSLAAAGHDADAISSKIGLSVRTIHYLNASVCRKLDVSFIEHAVAVALRLGIIR